LTKGQTMLKTVQRDRDERAAAATLSRVGGTGLEPV